MPPMPLRYDAKPTFAGGEFSPLMYGRIDLAKYPTAMKTARNVIIHPQGAVSNRAGTRYVAKAISNSTKSRLIPFEFSDTQSYMLEFGNNLIRFYINRTQITSTSSIPFWSNYPPTTYNDGDQVQYAGIIYQWHGGPSRLGGNNNLTIPGNHDLGPLGWDTVGPVSAGTPYQIVSPYKDTDLPLIKYTQSANTLYLAHPNYPPMTLVRTNDTNWTLTAFPFIGGPFIDENITNTTLTQDFYLRNLAASDPIFNSGHVGSLWKLDLPIPAQSDSQSLTGTHIGVGIPTARDFNISTTGTWSGTFVIEKSIPNSGVWTTISQVFASVAGSANFNSNGDAGEVCYLRVNVLTLTSGTINYVLSASSFIAHVTTTITSFVNSRSLSANPYLGDALNKAYAYIIDNLQFYSAGINTTTNWYEGAWSTYRGWPSAVTFYQDRLGWASTPDNPLGSWWSQNGDYVNYGISDPLVDSDAISFNMPTRKINQCQHLLPMYIVVALTSSGEISIGPGGSGDFTPSSVDLRPQTYHGAASTPPVFIGNEAVFVQARSAQVRSISYQYFTNIFTGAILNLMSSHLTENFTLTDMTFAESPDSIIYSTRSDGELLAFTYLPEQQVNAWTHWDTGVTDSFESCSVIPATTYDELWVVVNRANGRFIECLAQRLPTYDTKDQFHVDCGIDYSGSPTSSISGLDHLDGQSVMVLGDGNVMGPFTVSGGTITLPKAVSLAHIGLPFTSDVETMNIEIAGQDGTSQGRRQRVAYVTPRFIKSLGGKIGQSSANLRSVNPNPTIPAGSTYAPLFTGDIPKVSLPGDWTNNGRVFFRQTDPLPFTLSGLFPVIEQGNI